jgi:hypothetical protein
MASDDAPLQGSCLCGVVRFRITGPFLVSTYCHCRHCQKRTGSGVSAQGRVAAEDFELVTGAELLQTFTPTEGRPKVFCSVCGSSLFSGDPLGEEQVSVRLGALDGDPGIRPQVRLYVDSAAAWEPVPDDDLPQFPSARAS